MRDASAHGVSGIAGGYVQPIWAPLHAVNDDSHCTLRGDCGIVRGMPTDDEAAIRDRLAKLAAEGRHVEREIVAWQLAEYIMSGPVGFNPHRRPAERRARRMRYAMIEAT